MKDCSSNQQQSFRPIVGIDLGTTTSAVAYIHLGKPDMVPAPNNKRIIPSVVFIDHKGKVVVGEDARAALVALPDRTIAAIKRKMGSSERISLAGLSLLPQEVSALILKELKKLVDDHFGEGEKEAVITVPAYFTDEQRRATKQAGELAGFIVERIINEPTAAALAYGLGHVHEDGYVLVYDLGGGTFDVSVVEMMSGLLEVKASAGNSLLGGEDFDWLIVNWLAEQMIEKHGVDPRLDLSAKALLKAKAEKIKRILSSEETVTVSLPLVTEQGNRPEGLCIEVTRAQFITLIDSLLQETMTCVGDVLQDSGLSPSDIDEILLVGGSTRIPRVRDIIRKYFNKEPRSDVDPEEAVALGAAVQAGLKCKALAESGLIATDVAPFSIGIVVLKEWKDLNLRHGGFHVIIPRNTTIPVTRTATFSTAVDGQTKATIEIYQGEHEWVKQNHQLGELLLTGIPANQARAEQIEVSYHYNLNGILEVTAKCVSTGKAISVTIQDALNSDYQEAFSASAAKLEVLFNKGASDMDLDSDGDDDDEDDDDWELLGQSSEDSGDDNDVLDSDDAPTALLADAAVLLERAQRLLEEFNCNERTRVEKLIASLRDSLAAEDVDRLQRVIDEATDTLLDLEL